MSNKVSVKKIFLTSKKEQFQAIVNSEEAKTDGLIPTLLKMKYQVRRVGNHIEALKGRVVISFGADSPLQAMVTPVRPINL